MKKNLKLQLISIISISVVIITVISCRKKEDSTAPVAETTAATYVGQTWAALNGVANAGNLNTIASFDYDSTTSYTINIPGNPDTITGNSNLVVTAPLTGLKTNTTYHYRLKLVNPSGTIYGDDKSFTTLGKIVGSIRFNPDLTYGSVSDNDGNVYKTILIGAQTWMAENLKTTRYNDNTLIPLIFSDAAWAAATSPGFCWYNNDSITYGALYNWYTVGTTKLCPAGWHIPSDEEWTTLTTYLGGDSAAYNKLKETGVSHWQSPNSGASDESGMAALAGGYRNSYGTFGSIKKSCYWWTSDEFNAVDADYWLLAYDYKRVTTNNSSKKSGFSVRCIKNN